MRLELPQAKILDFDIENRPLSYMGGDLTTSEITAIAAGWSDMDTVACWALGECSPRYMLERFVHVYNEADIVTGHYIRKHDLPIINGALVEFGMPTLGPKLTIDTKLDLTTWSFMAQTKSQEALGRTLNIPAPKIGMSQADWREANRLTLEGIQKTRERVIGDVVQHKQLRLELTRRGLLGPPQRWQPKG